MLSEMSEQDWLGWMAMERINPQIGTEREDWRMGTIASVVAEPHRDRKKRPKPFTANDWMPDLRSDEQRQLDFYIKQREFWQREAAKSYTRDTLAKWREETRQRRVKKAGED